MEAQQQDNPSSFLMVPLVVRLKILSHLKLQEQLLLRQVCQTTKHWIDSSSLSQHTPLTVIEDYGWNTFAKFLQKRPPHVLEQVYIKNDSDDYLKDPCLPQFLRMFGSSIRSLRIKRFSPFRSSGDLQFFEGFPNLTELELNKVSIPSDKDGLSESFPTTFKNLKSLKIGNVVAHPEPPADDSFGSTLIPLGRQRPMGLYVWNLIKFCENIEFLGYPGTAKYFFHAFTDGRGRGEFGMFCDYVRERFTQSPNGPGLKFCDLQNDNCQPDTRNALPLLRLGADFGVKFLNLNANLYQYIKIEALVKMYDLPKNTQDCILSFRHFNCLIPNLMPSIQKISMSASEVNSMLDYSCIFNGPKAFPNLEEIDINVDIGFSLPETNAYHRAREFRSVQTLLTHFFYDAEMILEEEDEVPKYVRVYENVHTLSVRFQDVSSKTMKKANPEDLPLSWIAKSVPNLRKLVLSGWTPRDQNTFKSVLKNFQSLEELKLEDCDNLEGLLSGQDYDTVWGRDLIRLTIRRNDKDCQEDAYEYISHFAEHKLNFRPSTFLSKSAYHGHQTTWGTFVEECYID